MTNNYHNLLAQCHFQFPNPINADRNGTGLIAVGANLSPATLITAYSQGLFPWFNEDEPIAWWCPEPRCIIKPKSYQPSKSLQKQARSDKSRTWQVTLNQAFADVIHACSLPRSYTNDTWIHDEMIDAYCQLHQLGFAHSIEVWNSNEDNHKRQLIGGLYGLKIGGIYFGESMFHRQSNASKMAFWGLMRLCEFSNMPMVDCQLPNDHLMSLGATTMTRQTFLTKLPALLQQTTPSWQANHYSPIDCHQLLYHDSNNAWKNAYLLK
ncbi:leucyl/phenylalanyl-tRNA--protein transferase [Psychrobacter sp. I-STPA10]|uniref:leucyl/phenylalanyl-tRNA--protein transferase n=1 Tax=Psychrobacter sp. I-STPA10 TaxID=2585769 RepID=UPI002E76524D|nr:leucyl/phenylalanyl-tRNA--protein transferase [Psychrobacter sp. I-STPA10]